MAVSEWLFFDPIVRGPLFACACMGALGAVIGVYIVLRQHSLVGEAVSHACYPGMVIGAIFSEVFFDVQSGTLASVISFGGAALSSLMAVWLINWFVERRCVASDAALSFVLSASFATGLLLVSAVQSVYPSLWRRLQALLMGQAATVSDRYALLVLIFTLVGGALLIVFRRSLKTHLFDADFARLGRLTNRWIEWMFVGILVSTIIIAIRFMGVVLLSAMLIFPVMSARLVTSNFEKVVWIAALIGSFCGFWGVLLSHEGAFVFRSVAGHSFWLPTGPLIALLLAACFCVALLFSPSEGLVVRAWRRSVFVRRCQRENVVKHMWKECVRTGTWTISYKRIHELFPLSRTATRLLFRKLKKGGLIRSFSEGVVEMTATGILLGRKLVRLHRLWELYLVECCGMAKERVHPNAEEMEHILTPEVERKLSLVLHNPSVDPHKQPIPSSEEELFIRE